jgi:predicted deacetylase
MIRVALRFDDASAISHRGIEQCIITALSDTDTQAKFAVIPFRNTPLGRKELDPNNGDRLLAAHQRGLIEVALHGHSHLNQSVGRQSSEFYGIAAERQHSMLSEAAARLRMLFGKAAVHGFVPPWNSYDATTLTTLNTIDFEYISAGDRSVRRYSGPLAVLPRTCQFTALESAVAEARRYAAFSPYIVVVLHHYDFREDGGMLDQYALTRLLAWLKQQPDVQVMTLHGLAITHSNRALAQPSLWSLRAKKLHWRLRSRLPTQCLVPAPLWRVLLA